jgi:hypothetical protein
MIWKLMRALVFIVETILAPAGTNLLGLTMAVIIFVPLGIFIQKLGGRIEGVIEGAASFIGGVLTFGIDWIYRHIGPHEFQAQEMRLLKFDILFDLKKGGRILFLPVWIWGALCMISGIITVVWTLIKG